MRLSSAEGKAIVEVVEGADTFFTDWPQHYSEAREGVAAILKKQEQQQVVCKLATEQQTMLSTLERMSWLVLLLATATFLASIQPPGGFDSERLQVLVSGRSVCSSNSTSPLTDTQTPVADVGVAGNSSTAASSSSKQSPHTPIRHVPFIGSSFLIPCLSAPLWDVSC